MGKKNRYTKIIEKIFSDRYQNGQREVVFERDDLVSVANQLKVKLPDNLGDLIYTKGGNDRLSIVQIEQDFAMCTAKFPSLVCRPFAGQFMRNDVIALFEFVKTEERIAVSTEKHYRLVPKEELSPEDLQRYSTSTD